MKTKWAQCAGCGWSWALNNPGDEVHAEAAFQYHLRLEEERRENERLSHQYTVREWPEPSEEHGEP